VVEVRL
jgi:hypothetical protein